MAAQEPVEKLTEPVPAPAIEHVYYGLERGEERLRTAHGEIVVYTARSPDKESDNESDNEDSAAVIEVDGEQTVLAVADGVGGQPGGQHASALALEALRRSVAAAREDPDALREAILSGFDDANREVLARASGAATTLLVAQIHRQSARVYHVGDSGGLVFGGRGKVKLQTISHSPIGYAVESGLLDERDALAHEDRNLVSNVIGDPNMHVVMSSALKLRPRDTLLIASDGLFDNLYTEEIVEGLRRGTLARSLAALVAGCEARMSAPREGLPSKPDDLTVLAYRPTRSTAARR